VSDTQPIGHPEVARRPLRIVRGDPLSLTFRPPAVGGQPGTFPPDLMLTLQLGDVSFTAAVAPDGATASLTLTPDQVAATDSASQYTLHRQAPGEQWPTRILGGPVLRD